MDENENQRYYFSPVSGGEKGGLLRELTSSLGAIELWKKGMEEKDLETFSILNFDEPSLTLELSPEDQSLFKEASRLKLQNQEVFCKFSLERIHYFTYSLLQYNQSQETYTLTLDKDIFAGRQRENYRLKASSRVRIDLKIGEDTFECLDISAGGTSFLFSPEKKLDIKASSPLRDAILIFCGRKYLIPRATITKTWPLDPGEKGHQEGCHCAGVFFIDLSEKTREALFIQVNAEARGEEIQRKFFSKKS